MSKMQAEMNELRTRLQSEMDAEVAARRKTEETRLNDELAALKKSHAEQVLTYFALLCVIAFQLTKLKTAHKQELDKTAAQLAKEAQQQHDAAVAAGEARVRAVQVEALKLQEQCDDDKHQLEQQIALQRVCVCVAGRIDTCTGGAGATAGGRAARGRRARCQGLQHAVNATVNDACRSLARGRRWPIWTRR